MTNFHGGEAKKNFEKKKIQNGLSIQKKLRFSKPQLNLYGCEAVRRKLKDSLKTQKMHFLPVFELTSDSLSAL